MLIFLVWFFLSLNCADTSRLKFVDTFRPIGTFWHKKLFMRTLFSSDSLRILLSFCVWFFGPKLCQYPWFMYCYPPKEANLNQPHKIYYRLNFEIIKVFYIYNNSVKVLLSLLLISLNLHFTVFINKSYKF